ncbi:hypothetical protein M3Y97_00301500 [Aphelenchoides bicaudatus]|nr:hypothetical protein M3Y97_00301500 [Aphelenchoides bicaudatus]
MVKRSKKVLAKDRSSTPPLLTRGHGFNSFNEDTQTTPKRKFIPPISEETLSTPPSRPWNIQVQSARKNHHSGKCLKRAQSISGTVRRSTRLSTNGVQLEGIKLDLRPLNSIDQQIENRVNEMRKIDYEKLKRELIKRGKVKRTPKSRKQRPVYNLMDPDSVNRKFVDDEAAYLLENGETDQEFQRRPGAVYFRRLIFDNV